jgi:hypothetical protein
LTRNGFASEQLADDQRDVLEALRILLKGEGHQTESVTSISGIFNALTRLLD